MQFSEIQERVQRLKSEVAELRAACETYHRISRHSTLEMNEQLRRELRIQQIVGELASLTKRKV